MTHFKKSFTIFGLIVLVLTYTTVIVCNASDYGYRYQLQPFSTIIDAAKLSRSILFSRMVLASACCFMGAYLLYQRKLCDGKNGRFIWVASYPIVMILLASCLGKSFFVDDLIGAAAGTIAGIFLGRLRKVRTSRKDGNIQKAIMKTYCAVYAALLLGILIADLVTPYGGIRYNNQLMPKELDTTALAEQVSEPVNVYTHDNPGLWALTKKLCKYFDIGLKKMRVTTSWFYGRQDIELMSIHAGPWLIVDSDGNWRYQDGEKDFRDREYAMQTDRQQEKALELIAPFLYDDEQIMFESINWNLLGTNDFDYPVLVYRVSSQRSDVYYLDNEINIAVFDDSILMLRYGVIRGIAPNGTNRISAKDAYDYATRFCADWQSRKSGGEWAVLSVEETYVPCRKWLLPAYSIQMGRYEHGVIVERTETIVDAVDRGILPYIIPGGVLFILLGAAVIAVRRKSAGRKGQASTSAGSPDGKAGEQMQSGEQIDMEKN